MRSHKTLLQRLLLPAIAVVFGLMAPTAQAQTAAGISDYFILGQDEHVWNFMNRVRVVEGTAAFPTPNRLNSVSSATATANGQRITYDHWEDGLESDINNPVQTSTLVLGDANNANGRVCDYSVDPRVFPCNGLAAHDDALYQGTPISLASDQGMTGGCAAPYAVPPSLSQVRCSFPVSPAIASVTRVGDVVTVTVTPATGHGFATGSTVRIAGANEVEYNGSWTITTAGPASLTFQYTRTPSFSGATPTTATGVITATFPTIRFDGGDRVYSTGGSLSIAQIQDPGTPLIGGGTELLARELVKNATAYSIPVGENLFPGTNNVYFSIKYAALDIVAFDDDTNVTVTSPGAGSRSVVLHRGQHYSTCATFGAGVAGNAGSPGACLSGAIDGPPPPSGPDNRGVFPALALTVNAGTKIATSGPLNALIFTAGSGGYQTRHYATLPDILHTTDYVTTAPGDSAAGPAAPGTPVASDMNLFIYNPSSITAITVTTTDTLGSTVISIPANSVVDYRNASGRFVPADSGVRLTSNRPFWGLSAYDSLTTARDWGHAWLGTRFLRNDYTVAYSPGTQPTQIANISQPANPAANPTVTSATRAGTTVTITAAAHGFLLGDTVIIGGAVSAPNNFYNGAFVITAVTANTFQYTAGGTSSVTPATGTITAQRAVTVVTGTSHFLSTGSIARISAAAAAFNGDKTIGVINATTFAYPATVAGAASATSGVVVGLCDNSAVPTCNSYNRDPIWVAGTQNNTQVRVDFDADGLWDFVDTDSDNCPNSGDLIAPPGTCTSAPVPAGCSAVTANSCVYLVNAPGSASRNVLRVWDPSDMDNAGTRIFSTRPVALSWGEDTDQGQGADPSPDNGYTVYPPIAIDLVLGIQKDVSPSRVPLSGGIANYTVRIFSGDYGPINFIAPRDSLPAGITCAAYVAGSTVITYPDLSTSTVDPVCTNSVVSSLTSAGTTATVTLPNHGLVLGEIFSISGATSTAPNTYNGTFIVTSVVDPNSFTYTLAGAAGSATAGGTILVNNGRSRLSWAPAQTTLLINQSTIINYQLNIPATGASRSLENEAQVSGYLGSSLFNPKDTAILNQSDITFTKSVSAATAIVGDVLTYTMSLTNGGTAETNVSIVDAIPAFTSFVPASINTTAGARAITSLNQAAGTATATMPFAHGWVTGTQVTIAGAAVAAYNGVKSITVISPTQFTFAIAPATASPAGGAPTASVPVGPFVGAFNSGSNDITWSATARSATITSAGSLATVTSAAHGFVTGQWVTIAGATSGVAPNNYNGTFVITVLTANTFTYTMTAASGSTPAGGTITATPALAPNAIWTVSFQVRVNDSTPAGTVIPNKGNYSSSLVPTFDSNTVNTTVLGPILALSKSGPPGPVTPGQVLDFELLLENTGTGSAQAVGITDNLAGTNLTYVAGSTTFSLNGGSFAATTDANDADQQRFAGTTLDFAYYRPVASITHAVIATRADVTTSIPHFFVAGNTVTISGADDPLFNGTFTVLAVPAPTATTFSYTLPSSPAGATATGPVTAELNPRFTLSPGSTLRVRFKARVDNGTAGLFASNQAVASATGQPPAPSNLYQVPIVAPPGTVSITKTSSGAGTVVPGQVVTYTVVVQNNTATTQTSTTITDALPTGTTFVPGSASVVTSTPVFRTTEYFVPTGSFTGTTFTQTLNQTLAANYFVILQGSDVTAATGPSTNYIRLNGDPYGTGSAGGFTGIADIVAAPAGPNNVLRFARNLATGSWTGVITVVECLTACATAGFELLDAGAVTQAANTLTAAATSDVAWLAPELPRIMLVGGFQGAGCTTASAVAQDTKVCHSRWTPSGTATMTWNRNAAGTSTTPNIVAAVNTVMVVRWGSEWTVQLRRINAANGGADINAAGEYNNSTAITSVPRANTWVWGTGFTTNNEQRNASEGVALTLGNGVTQLASETILSAGQWNNGQTIDFDVYALTHPSLVVDHRFKSTDGTNDPTTLIYDQTTLTGSGARMSLSYQGNSNNDNNYPQSMFSSRFLSPSQIRVQRTQAAGNFAAWTQGINFSGINGTSAPVSPGHAPPNLVIAGDGFTIAPGGSMTLTYQVTVNAVPGTPTITNTATYISTEVVSPGISATVVDNVAIPAVRVEPNNAGFAAVPATAAGTPILFTQGVTNLGTTADSFAVTLKNQAGFGWRLDLIDPATGSIIATDTNGDGVWDGGVTISTGSLAVGETKQYTVRATVPLGTVAGTQNSVELTAVSALSAAVKDVGTDEITVLPAAIFGPVVLLPDHSGIVAAGETIAYTHRLFNNTGAAENFDLRVDTTLSPTWPTAVYADTNGDGVYTPGSDLALPPSPTPGFVSSGLLPNGGSQILFVVTTAPVGTAAGVDDVAHLTARSRTNPVQVDAVTDTTTILAATTHDLAGGGTRMAAVGDDTVFPGTLYNLKAAADRFDFSITPSSLFSVDGLPHPTVLRVGVDGNNDGLLDTIVATDTDGNGVWDTINPAFNTNANGFPDLPVAGNGSIEYQLERQISPSQQIWKEYATVTATSLNDSTQKDSITAQWIIANLSRASVRGVRVNPSGLVEFVTGTQQNTAFFNLYETADRSLDGEKTLLNAAPIVSPVPDSLMPIMYKVETSPVRGPYLLIEETETTGNVLTYGPYSITNTRLKRGLERIEEKMNSFGVPSGKVRVSRQSMARVPGRIGRTIRPRVRGSISASAPHGLLLEVAGEGAISIPVSVLQGSGFPTPAPQANNLRLTRGGIEIPVSLGNVSGVPSLTFVATALSTDFTDNSSYVLSWPSSGAVPTPTVTLSQSMDAARPGFTRIERNSIYANSVPQGSDPWQWDLLFGDGTTWPYPAWDPGLGTFDLSNLGAPGGEAAPVKIRLTSVTADRHAISASLNGYTIGSIAFQGKTSALLEGSVPQYVLRQTGNQLTITYSAEHDDGTSAPSGFVYLDYMDIAAPLAPAPSTAVLASIRSYDPKLTGLSGTKYLILTHSLFRAQADRLAALKTAEKLKATVVDVQTAYDRYSGGVQEPRALVAAIKEVAAISPKLQYVVLFGDDSLDPRNFLGGATTSYVPSVMGFDGASRIPNENAYADLNGDGSPDLAVGRLPVTTPEEAAAVVDKIENQTRTLLASNNVHVFVSDDSRETDSKFGDNAREMAQKLPSGVTSVLADVGSGVGLARSAMFGTWQSGSTMTHYFGHGGPEIWTDEALFSVDDLPDLEGRMSPMVLLAWACQSQFYQNYYGPSVNEGLFLSPGSGALASFGPVGITSPEHQKKIYEHVYQWLYTKGLSLGEIIRQAKVAALAESPNNQDVIDGFVFFGDPSLSLPQPTFGNPSKGKIPR